MKAQRIRIVSVDVMKVDFPRGIVYFAYTLRVPAGDNDAATDVAIDSVDKMCEELFEAARAKASILAEVFSAVPPHSEKYQVADYKATRDRLAPLFRRLHDARKLYQEGLLTESEQSLLETDGTHLLRPDLDLDGRAPEERLAILVKRAGRYLDAADPDTARRLLLRALRLKPDDEEARRVLALAESRLGESRR